MILMAMASLLICCWISFKVQLHKQEMRTINISSKRGSVPPFSHITEILDSWRSKSHQIKPIEAKEDGRIGDKNELHLTSLEGN